MERNVKLISESISSLEEVSFEKNSASQAAQVFFEQGFGQYLRQQRTLRGITKEEITHMTKVSRDYLDALENNRFDELPPKPFIVGFLRVFGQFAGMDSDELVNRFLDEVARQQDADHMKGSPQGYLRRNMRKLLTICGLACLLILMFMPLFRH